MEPSLEVLEELAVLVLDPTARASIASWITRINAELSSVVTALAAEESDNHYNTTAEAAGVDAGLVGSTTSTANPYAEPAATDGGPGPCLLGMLESDLAGKLCKDCLPNHPEGVRLPAVLFFSTLLTKVPSQHILLHQGLMAPISQAVKTFAEQPVGPTDPEMPHRINLLCELCDRLIQEQSLLPMFMSPPSSSSSSSSATTIATNAQGYRKSASKAAPSQFWLLAALIPQMYLEGDAGGRVRLAILQCVKLSRSHPEVATYIERDSPFLQTLAVGLAGLYSEVPATLPGINAGGMDWKLNGTSAPELEHFFSALTFCDQLVRIGPVGLVRRTAQLLSIGFIQPVLLPKLHQSQVDEAVAATAYLDACIRSDAAPRLSPRLIRPFIEFILRSKYDSGGSGNGPVRTLDLLISRLCAKGNLGMVTLRLFNSLLALNCEDVMIELCFRHMVGPAAPPSPPPGPPAVWLVGAARYFSTVKRKHAAGTSAAGNGGGGSDGGGSNGNSSDHEDANDGDGVDDDADDGSFDAYVLEATEGISDCRDACMCWSAPYDAAWLAGQRRRSAQQGAAPFAFWEALMHLLSKFLEQPPGKNLLVTAAITRLARFPHPAMQIFLFSPNTVDSGGGGGGGSDEPARMKGSLRGHIKLLVAKVAEIEEATIGFAEELRKEKEKEKEKAKFRNSNSSGRDGGGSSKAAETLTGAVGSLFRTPSKLRPAGTAAAIASGSASKQFKTPSKSKATAAATASPSTPSTSTGFFSSVFGPWSGSLSGAKSPSPAKPAAPATIQLSFGGQIDDRLLSSGSDLYVSDDATVVSPPVKKKRKPSDREVLAVFVLEEFLKEMVAQTLTHAAN